MGNVKASFAQLEILFGLRLLHGADQAVIFLSPVIELPKAANHLPGCKEVVLVVFVIHILGIFAHNRRNQNAVAVIIGGCGVCLNGIAGIGPHRLGIIVVRINNGAAQKLGVAKAVDILVRSDRPVCDPVQKQHVQRDLVHAAADPVNIAVIIVFFPGCEIVIACTDGIRVRVIFLQHQQQSGLPVAFRLGLICRRSRFPGGFFRFFRIADRQNLEQQEKAQQAGPYSLFQIRITHSSDSDRRYKS